MGHVKQVTDLSSQIASAAESLSSASADADIEAVKKADSEKESAFTF